MNSKLNSHLHIQTELPHPQTSSSAQLLQGSQEAEPIEIDTVQALNNNRQGHWSSTKYV